MKGDQWFQLWLSIGQVVGGVGGVYLAARLALGAARNQRVEDRSRVAAEKLLFGLEASQQRLDHFVAMITIVLRPSPESIEEAISHGADPNAAATEARETFSQVSSQLSLLSPMDLQRQVTWASMSLANFSLMAVAARYVHRDITIADLTSAAGDASIFLGRVKDNLRRYLRGERPLPMDGPTHWWTPVGSEQPAQAQGSATQPALEPGPATSAATQTATSEPGE